MAGIDVRALAKHPVDRFLNFFTPERANDRLRARVIRESFLEMASSGGGYDAARATNRGTRDLRSRSKDGSANQAIVPDLTILRRASSDLVRNSGVAKGGLDQLTSKTLGQGLTLQARPDPNVLGISEDAAAAKAREFESLWWHWHKRADASRRFDFGVLERLGLYSTFEMGDCFALKVSDQRPGDLFSFKIQLIEAARVSNPNFGPDTPNLVQGIVMDNLGRPTDIWVADRHPWDFSPMSRMTIKWTKYPIFGNNTGRRNIIHLMLPNRIGQTRGVPILAPVIEVLEQLTTYSRAELMATVVNSMFAVVSKTKEDAAFSITGETLQDSGLKRMGITPQAGMVLEGLQADESIESFTPKRPNQNFESFWDALTDEIGSAIGVAGEVLRRKFKASYSASRAALDETYDSCRTHSTWYPAALHQECYEEIIFEAVTSGRVDLPGWEDPIIWDAWVNSVWIPPPRPALDREKEARAARELIDGGLSTEAEQTTLLTGGDWEQNQIQRKKEAVNRAAFAPPTPPAGAPAKPAPGNPPAEPPPNPDQNDLESETPT